MSNLNTKNLNKVDSLLENEVLGKVAVLINEYINSDVEVVSLELAGSKLRGTGTNGYDFDFNLAYNGNLDEAKLVDYVSSKLSNDNIKVNINFTKGN